MRSTSGEHAKMLNLPTTKHTSKNMVNTYEKFPVTNCITLLLWPSLLPAIIRIGTQRRGYEEVRRTQSKDDTNKK